jgi:2-dehydro-3-deoxyphosphooctonate aldolase (KDO 8-P synthase)
MEVHDDPNNALSDPHTQINLTELEMVLKQAKLVHELRLELMQKSDPVGNLKEEWNYAG